MSDFYLWSCPTCHTTIGGWNYDLSQLPVRCPNCGAVNIKDDENYWNGNGRPVTVA